MEGRPRTIGSTLLGKLRLDALLGEGGMGAVYRVTHLTTGHVRALKLLREDESRDPEIVLRFEREARISSIVRSPAIVETFDAGVLDDGTPYVLMELLEGEPLDVVFSRGPLDPSWFASRLGPACQALASAHEAGIVHRDLKPANLFCSPLANGEEIVRVLDFGIAHFAQPPDVGGRLTTQRSILGTPCYMAPEQLMASHRVDGKADVYALGVVLYEGLSGRRPYECESFGALCARAFDADYPALRVVRSGLSPRIYELVSRAMHVDPAHRMSMNELQAMLGQLETPRVRSARNSYAWASLVALLVSSLLTGAWLLSHEPVESERLLPASAREAHVDRPDADAPLERTLEPQDVRPEAPMQPEAPPLPRARARVAPRARPLRPSAASEQLELDPYADETR